MSLPRRIDISLLDNDSQLGYNFSRQQNPGGHGLMIVCHCVGATDTSLTKVIQEDGAVTLAEVIRRTGAGRCCAPCREEISTLLYSLSPATHTPVVDVTPAPTSCAA